MLEKFFFLNNFEKFFFLFLFIVCTTFILLHGMMLIGINIPTQFSNDLYRINYDHSYGEFFQYILLFGSLIFNFFIFLKEKFFIFTIPFILFLLLDDFFMLHDNFNSIIFAEFDILIRSEFIPIRPKDIYEFIWHLFFTLPLFAFSLLCFKEKNLLINKFKFKYLISIILLIFFGLIIDFLSVIIVEKINTPRHPLNTIVTLFEEGGEMLACSFLLSSYVGYLLEKIKN